MGNILNLALKKDVFENLQNGVTNEIVIDGSRWWKKRLMDLDTGRFKDFDVACISSGSSNKVEYEIKSIEQRGRDFVVIVDVGFDQGEQPVPDEGDSELEDVEPIQYSDAAVPPIHTVTVGNGEGIEITGIKGTQEDLLKPERVNPVTVETGENGEIIVKQTYVKPILEIKQNVTITKDDINLQDERLEEKSEDEKLVSAVKNIFNKFCELNDVFVVSMPDVTIRNNGQVFGCKKRIIADRDADVKFGFNKKEIIKYSSAPNTPFLAELLQYLENLLKNNYVFVNKNESKFRRNEFGDIIFTVVAVAKKKYFFIKK